jgi:ABC-type dipeptide/oligopeptide/nickel transport system ATPase component
MGSDEADPILRIENLSISYPISIGTVRAVRGVSLQLAQGEALGLVGESGCGKSTLGLSILKLLRPPGRITSGRIIYKGRDILGFSDRELLSLRGGNISMIFQNPLTSLNPLFTVEAQFLETIRFHDPSMKKTESLSKVKELLKVLGIEASRMKEYPHQLSGGMRQRVMIGLALIMNPDVLIADEPTTSLDVIVEAGFTELLSGLRSLYSLSVILITHNLGLVAEVADRIAVMYGGIIVEVADSKDIYSRPMHPYTKGLISCVPNILLDQKELATMPGSPPDLVEPPEAKGRRFPTPPSAGPSPISASPMSALKGCPFAPRCPRVMDVCRNEMPILQNYRDGQAAACWLYEKGG